MLTASLFATWFIWGSTYLAIKFTLVDLGPFLSSGIRFMVAGGLLVLAALWRAEMRPTRKQIGTACFAGIAMLALGNGAICVAAQTAPTGLVALVMAATPLITVLLHRLLGGTVTKGEWLGVTLGLAGVGFIQWRAGVSASNALWLVLAGAMVWALASALLPRLPQAGPWWSAAVQMLAGGAASLFIAPWLGESLPVTVSLPVLMAMAYLILAGSLGGYCGYLWLLNHTRPALATSFFSVNPLVALMLGCLWAGETLSADTMLGATVVVAGVAMVSWANRAR